MKNFSIIHILLFILCMFVYRFCSAQDFLVTAKGDTVKGEVKLVTYGNEKRVQVAAQEGKKKLSYSLFETKYFRLKDENYYPIKGHSGYNFMKLLKRGYLSLYAFQLENQITYDGLLLTKLDGGLLEVPNLNFKRQMAKFLGDCERVASRIENGDLAKKDLHYIIDEYNLCIDSKSEKIANRKQLIKPSSTWNILQDKLNKHADFEGKSSALEMVAEIKSKLARGEKIPNFMLDGLKNTLSTQEDLKAELESALASLNE